MSTDTGPRRWINTLLKILFFVALILIVLFTVLGNMGGNSDVMKESVERFAYESTGYPAKIETLNSVTFFPTLSFDLENLTLYRTADEDLPIVKVGSIRAALGFWDAMLRQGKLRALSIQKLQALPGIVLDKTVTFDSVAIVDTGDDSARLEGKGMIGTDPVVFLIDMAAEGEGRKRLYSFGRQGNVSLQIGAVSITARIIRSAGSLVRLEELHIQNGKQDIATGHLTLARDHGSALHIGGALTLTTHGSVLKPDVVVDSKTGLPQGAVRAIPFDPRDIHAGSPLDKTIHALIRTLGDPQKDNARLDTVFNSGEVILRTGPEGQEKDLPLRFKNSTAVLNTP